MNNIFLAKKIKKNDIPKLSRTKFGCQREREREREREIYTASFGVLVEYLGSRYRGRDWHGNVVVHLNLTANLPLNLFENLVLGMKEARL